MLPAHRSVPQALPAVTRDQLKRLEVAISTQLQPVDAPLQHDFIPGVYCRKLTIPAGAVLVGKIHKDLHLCIVAKGRIMVASEQGTKELVAGDVFVSEPGVKRAGYAIEETVFINIHTNESNDTDLKVLENKLIVPEAIGYTKAEVQTWLG